VLEHVLRACVVRVWCGCVWRVYGAGVRCAFVWCVYGAGVSCVNGAGVCRALCGAGVFMWVCGALVGGACVWCVCVVRASVRAPVS
jgi:hypothetical protein